MRGARQAPEELRHPMGAAGHHRRTEVMRAGHHVRDDLGVGGIGDRWLEDTDHGGDARTEADGLADHGRVAVERGDPEPVREDRGARGSGPVVLGVQQTAEHRMKAHHLEERATDDASFHNAGLGAETNQREIDRGEIPEGADGRDARLEVVDFGHRERRVLRAKSRRALANVDQSIFIAIDERAEKHASNDAEDRGVGADAESERDHDGGRQALRTAEGAQGNSHVASERRGRVEPAAVPDAPHRVADRRGVSQFPQRGQASGFGILAAIDSFFHAEGQMSPDFVVQLTFVGAHGYSSPACAGFMMRPIAFTSCDQRSRSRNSWALPVAVSR